MNWDDATIEQLKALWAQGHSATDIGHRMGGVSKDAIIGKVHRLKLPARRSPITNRVAPWTDQDREQASQMREAGMSWTEMAERLGVSRSLVIARMRAAPARQQLEISGKRLSGPRGVFRGTTLPSAPMPVTPLPIGPVAECAYLLNDRRPWVACGARTVPGKSYCLPHQLICYVPAKPREEVAAPSPAFPHSSVQFDARV